MVQTQSLSTAIAHWLSDIGNFSRLVIERPLRPYQLEAAHAILDSMLHGRGRAFVVTMSRQAGKNELSAQLEAYLLNLYQRRGGQIVKASPTFQPQTINSLLRLQDRLNNPWNRNDWKKRQGHIIELHNARALFFSALPHASVVGAAADLLLEADEAQDIAPDKWSKDFAPMAASTHATRVLYGTAWTSHTLLATTIRALRMQEAADGHRRVFAYAADEVGHHCPPTPNTSPARSTASAATTPLSGPSTTSRRSTPRPACFHPTVELSCEAITNAPTTRDPALATRY